MDRLIIKGGQALDGELAQARGMVVAMETEDGPIRTVGNPIRAAGQATRYRRAPLLGEHTAELLGEAPRAARRARPACTVAVNPRAPRPRATRKHR